MSTLGFVFMSKIAGKTKAVSDKENENRELSEAQLGIDLCIVGDFDEFPVHQRWQILRTELRGPKPGTEDMH